MWDSGAPFDFYESGLIWPLACRALKLSSTWNLTKDDVSVGDPVTFHKKHAKIIGFSACQKNNYL